MRENINESGLISDARPARPAAGLGLGLQTPGPRLQPPHGMGSILTSHVTGFLRRVADAAAIPFGYLALALAASWPLARDFATYTVGDVHYDERHAIWVALVHGAGDGRPRQLAGHDPPALAARHLGAGRRRRTAERARRAAVLAVGRGGRLQRRRPRRPGAERLVPLRPCARHRPVPRAGVRRGRAVPALADSPDRPDRPSREAVRRHAAADAARRPARLRSAARPRLAVAPGLGLLGALLQNGNQFTFAALGLGLLGVQTWWAARRRAVAAPAPDGPRGGGRRWRSAAPCCRDPARDARSRRWRSRSARMPSTTRRTP